jgi:hypothetical protein
LKTPNAHQNALVVLGYFIAVPFDEEEEDGEKVAVEKEVLTRLLDVLEACHDHGVFNDDKRM